MYHLTTMVVLVVLANLAIKVIYLMMAGMDTSWSWLLVAAGATRETLLTTTKKLHLVVRVAQRPRIGERLSFVNDFLTSSSS